MNAVVPWEELSALIEPAYPRGEGAVRPARDARVCRHRSGPQILATVNAYLAQREFKVTTGTIVDATIISAPSATKNQDGQRDPQMHQTRMGNEWHFGMKAHIQGGQ